MPRTKQPRKPKQSRDSADDSDLVIRDFEKQAELRIANMKADSDYQINKFEQYIDMALSRLPQQYRQMTLQQFLITPEADKENTSEISSNDENGIVANSTLTRTAKKKRGTVNSDDGYVTEGPGSTISRVSRATKGSMAPPTTTRRTRSSSRNNRVKNSEIVPKTVTKAKGKNMNASTSKTDMFKTPASKQRSPNKYNFITPKVQPNTPLQVLRRPRQGEMVLSMQGSPLLVSAVVEEHSANINVPLANGDVISLLPNDGLRMSHIPALDNETMRQLQTLKSHIEKVIGSK